MYLLKRGSLGMADSLLGIDVVFNFICWDGGKMKPVIIRRQRKYEALQAIKDLEDRGFTLVYPLTEIKRDGKRFMTDSYNRRIFQENTFSSCWIAKMNRVAEA